jgi:hypothetical protein
VTKQDWYASMSYASGGALDWTRSITIPELIVKGQRILLTGIMYNDAEDYGISAADFCAKLIDGKPLKLTPTARALSQKRQLYALEQVRDQDTTSPEDKAKIQKFMDELQAFWATPMGQGVLSDMPAGTTVVVSPPYADSSIPKPEGWDSTYVLKDTPFGKEWQKK